jgi:hypothetical protein
VGAFGQKMLQPFGGLRDRVRPDNAKGVKAFRARGFGERGLERRQV